MPVLALRRPSAPPPSEGRRRLAEAVETLAALKARSTAIEAAYARAARAVTEAHTASAAATAAVETALRAASNHAVAVMLDPATAGPPPMTVAAARAAAQAAADAVVTAEQVRDTIQAEGAALPGKLSVGRLCVDDCVRDVLRTEGGPAIAALFARIEAAHRECLDAGLALDVLISAGIIADQGPNAYPNALEYRSRANFDSWSIARLPDASPTAAMWQAAWTALKADATAPVPVLA